VVREQRQKIVPLTSGPLLGLHRRIEADHA
jgi:hypothetical protein